VKPPQLVIVGTPSVDRIEVGGRLLDTVGGSGFISAVAGRLAGATTGILARVPRTLPNEIAVAFRPGGVDPGGLVIEDGPLPGFHISYDVDESATYLSLETGMEADLSAGDLPRRWLTSEWIHIGSLAASTVQQLQIARGLRLRGFTGGLSAGTFIIAAASEPELVRDLFDLVDVAFMNEEEAAHVFPTGMPPGTVVCVTTGKSGARRWDGSTWSEHPTVPVVAVDPTGAGDSFAGAYLGAMLSGNPDPVAAGLRIASLTIGGPGAAPIIDRLPEDASVHPDVPDHLTDGVEVDVSRVETLGSRLAGVAAAGSLAFCGSPFPEDGEDLALESLAIGTLHQYGFWTGTDHGYGGPMWATIEGVRRKGSDFIWHAFTRAVRQDPTVMDPDRMAADPLLFDAICTGDDGTCPIPDVGSHRALQQAYGVAAGRHGGIREIVDAANASGDPLATFLSALADLPGFGEDPLAKKANLLALILANRPERFLHLADTTAIAPIIDYHNLRMMLRTGCIAVETPDLAAALADRAWVSDADEAALRHAAYAATRALCDVSGLDVGAVDGFLFGLARSVCVETEDPGCGGCPISSACARRTELFQPIFRTTAY